MFQFPGLPPPALCVQAGVTGNDSRRVRPFGDPRVTGHVRLTVAYRSLSRPSSASCAKASTVCPYHLLLDGSVHTYTWRLMPPLRSDAIFLKKKISFKSHAMQLSRYGGGDPRGPDTARSRAATGLRISQLAIGGHGPSDKAPWFSRLPRRLFSLERR